MPVGSPAPALGGVAPDGSEAKMVFNGCDRRLLFLTSECKECNAAWERARKSAGESVAVVTPGPETESRRRVTELSALEGGERLQVVMSSEAWHAYGVARAPWEIEIIGGLVSESRPFR